MTWLAASADRRTSPLTMWPEVRSIIMLGLNYGPDDDPLAILKATDRAAISVYAQGDDYHELIKSKLKNLARWLTANAGGDVKVFVDTAAVMEKPLAAPMPDLDGRASTPTWFRANSAPGCFSARSSQRSICRPTPRNRTAAAVAGHVSIFAQLRLSLRRTSSTHDGAFPTSPSSTKGLFPANCVPGWATASSAATTVLRSARGTSLRARDARPSWRHATRYARRVSPILFALMMRNSGYCLPRRRSSGQDVTGLFETC